METIRKQAVALLEKCEIVTLASIDPKGNPRPVPLSKIKSDDIKTIWFSTGTESEKTKHFEINPHAGASFFDGSDSVVLTGKVTIVTDMEIKKALWVDWFYAHFPKGVEDPNYCILAFTAEHATYWINNRFIKEEV